MESQLPSPSGPSTPDPTARGDTERNPIVPAPVPTTVLQEPEPRSARWVLIRDALVFQGKLLVDGLKDLVLGPLTIVAAVFDLFAPAGKEGRHLYRALRWGKAFEDWIDLFEPVERQARAGTQLAEPSRRGVDAYVGAVEKLLADQVSKGGITASAKQTIDGALDNLRNNAMLGPRWQAPESPPEAPPPPESPDGDGA
jgi:hypothetical protein